MCAHRKLCEDKQRRGLNNKGFVRALLYPARLDNVHVHLNNQYLYRQVRKGEGKRKTERYTSVRHKIGVSHAFHRSFTARIIQIKSFFFGGGGVDKITQQFLHPKFQCCTYMYINLIEMSRSDIAYFNQIACICAHNLNTQSENTREVVNGKDRHVYISV